MRPRSAWRKVGRGAVPLLAIVSSAICAEAEPRHDGGTPPQDGSSPPAPPADPMRRIGSISVGHPHAGYLINAVRMPPGSGWVVSAPELAWGTDETIDALVRCLTQVSEQHPGGPKAIIGAISARSGGALPPHKSHRTGRDADVHFYLTHRKPKTWYEPATAENLDRPRTWALLRALVTEADVEMVLIDRDVQTLIEEYALSIGEPPDWVWGLFHEAPGSPSLVKDVPGHSGHMHIRFVSPAARSRGRDLYDRLVEQGHIELPSRELVHRVRRGDTLLGLHARYGLSVDELKRLNQLQSNVIRLGQELKVRERIDIRGARDPVLVPKRRLPPTTDTTSRRASPEPSRSGPG